MHPTFDLEALRTIVVGTDLGSFARAAVQLGRSQSAISMQLKKLEAQAGRPLFQRQGRGLVPTEAGEALLAYARRMIALNDEAVVSLGAVADTAAVRLGLPQDFFEEVVPEALETFSRCRPGVHVEVRAGRNYSIEEDVRVGRLDMGIAFFAPGSERHGRTITSLPQRWIGRGRPTDSTSLDVLPLVLFEHPCLFRQSALSALDRQRRPWRVSLTTPSLPGIWAALQAGLGISVRTSHCLPASLRDIGRELELPDLPFIDLRMVTAGGLSPAATDLHDALVDVIARRVVAK